MKSKVVFLTLLTASLLFVVQLSYAQFNLGGQVLQRAEYRHGFNTLVDTGVTPAFSIGQRARIHAGYTHEKVKAHIAVQDIRTWGNTPQIKLSDGFLSVHEAWVETFLKPEFSVKLGRQELDYDGARFLGNLDWVLQARAHDIALVKYEKENLSAHAGFAYNQDALRLTGNFYEMANQYKAAQMFRVQWTKDKLKLVGFLWNNGMQASNTDTLGVTEESVKYTQTFGLPTIEYKAGDFQINAFYYHQTGKTVNDQKVNGFDAGLEGTYLIKLNDSIGRNLRLTLGGEILSGTSQTDMENTVNRSYNPMYGTNHRFNGYMDYFYVGGRHINSVGLQDYFFKARFDINKKWFTALAFHGFLAAADVRDITQAGNVAASPFLGTELDFTFGILVNEMVSVQGGYSQMFASETMEMLRGPSRDATQNWAYVMVLFRPGMKNRYTGLKF